MTQEQLRKIDALVAEKVMGWRLENGVYPENKHIKYWMVNTPIEQEDCPRFSSDISDAWKVIDKMQNKYNISIDNELGNPWLCEMYLKANDSYPICEGSSDTAPLAICLAALKSLGVDTKGLE